MATETTPTKAAARAFVEKWRGRGKEDQDDQSFWFDLLTVLGMEDITSNTIFEHRTPTRGRVDVWIPIAKTFVEQKSLRAELDKPELRQQEMVTPYQQAKRYADSMPNYQRPDRIVVCSFDTFRIHDLNSEHPEKTYTPLDLEELPDNLHLLSFLVDPQKELRKREQQVSLDAGRAVARLHGMLRDQYLNPDSDEDQHALNVLLVRLVFCLFAEDAGLFPKDAFYNYLKGREPHRVRSALKDLFKYLNQPEDERSPYDAEDLRAFPYVNGGLFKDPDKGPLEVPNFTQEILDSLLNEISRDTDWSKISPTIFGGVFESTLNPETRRSGGMHYTSPKNIHRLIDPLFLDDLRAELQSILNDPSLTPRRRENALKRYHDKLGSLNFFDPACGSGNFLTETYISLRRLENRVLAELNMGQVVTSFEGLDDDMLKVSLDQFHGIEVNDFAVSVANTALWIARIQANIEAQEVVTHLIEDLPLKDSAHIVHGNALTISWEDVLDPGDCDYMIGNPPFIGKKTEAQREELQAVAGPAAGKLDYVAGWFIKAAQYMKGTQVEAAFVSTNSVNQGQQVIPLWKPLLDGGLVINFAHRSFKWVTETTGGASVTVVIIGFSYIERERKTLWEYTRHTVDKTSVAHINAYLLERPDEYIAMRSTPVSHVPRIVYGFKPADHGYLTPKADVYDEMVAADPDVTLFCRRFLGAREFVDGKRRYCLWLTEADLPAVARHAVAASLVSACAEWRDQQSKTGDAYKLRTIPWSMRPIKEFDPEAPYLLVPCHTSGARQYFPMGFIDDGAIPGNSCFFIPNATVFDFGIMTSRMHNIWLNNIGGRLKTDTRYASDLVYNTFVWPEVTDDQRATITGLAQSVLDERRRLIEEHSLTMEKMYKPDHEFFYPALFKAHAALDAAVERAYDLEPGLEEKDVVARLFDLYAEKIETCSA